MCLCVYRSVYVCVISIRVQNYRYIFTGILKHYPSRAEPFLTETVMFNMCFEPGAMMLVIVEAPAATLHVF